MNFMNYYKIELQQINDRNEKVAIMETGTQESGMKPLSWTKKGTK